MREALRKDLIRDEGVRLKAYKCPAGRWTVGVGRNVQDLGITTAEAMTLLDNDIERINRELDANLMWWRGRPEWVQRGMANAVFQLGLSKFLTFKRMLAALHAGDYETAKREAKDSAWYTQTPTRVERITRLFSEKDPDLQG